MAAPAPTPLEPAQPAIAGWHGKLPTLGDFASRRLDSRFIAAWHDWLSHGLAALQQAPDWPAAYLASPCWRFWLPPGVLPGAAGRHAWAGVLVPSVDQVGRYFPLTVALPVALPVAASHAEAAWAWLASLEAIAVDALLDDWTIDRLEAALAKAPAPAALTTPVALLAPASVPVLAAQPSANLALWRAAPELGPPTQLQCSGLLTAALLVQLLGGPVAEPATQSSAEPATQRSAAPPPQSSAAPVAQPSADPAQGRRC